MKRKLLLAGSALAIVIAAMAGYFVFIAGAMNDTPIPDQGFDKSPPSDYASADLRDVMGEARVGPTRKIEYPMYRANRVVSLLRADDSKVIDRGEYRLTRPEIFYFFGDGRVLRLRADQGDLTAGEAAERGLNPRRGVLTGNVVLAMFRTRRAGSPSPASQPAGFGENLRVRMDRVEFDYNDSYVTTDSMVTLESGEADAHVRGMRIHWDAVTRQITDMQLNTLHGASEDRSAFRGRMLVKRASMLRAGSSSKRQPTGGTTGRQAGSASSPADDPAGRPTQTYAATFNSDIDVRVLADPDTPDDFSGMLTSDRTVSMVFDFQTPRQPDERPSTADSRAASVGNSAARSAQPTAGVQTNTADALPTVTARPVARASSQPDDNILVTWAGVLRMVPADPTVQSPGGPSRRIIAEGDNVCLRQRDGKVGLCNFLSYDDATKSAELRGRPGQPASIAEPARDTRIVCHRLLYNGLSNRISIFETGWMQSRGDLRSGEAGVAGTAPAAGGGPPRSSTRMVRIDWDGGVEILLHSSQQKAASNMDMLGQGELSEATFSGNVRARQDDSQVAADTLTAYFFEPAKDVRPNQIARLVASGRQDGNAFSSQVKATFTGNPLRLIDSSAAVQPATQPSPTTRPDQQAVNSLCCDRLEFLMKVAADGTSVPHKAAADGHVTAVQDTATISAQRMELAFAASRDGDGNRYVPHEVRAFRDVRIADPARRLSASGTNMHALLGSDVAILHGQPAQVRLEDRVATGDLIEINRERQTFQVIGESKSSFKSDRDLSGRPVDSPMVLMVTARKVMKFDGINDVAELRGEVRAASERDYIQAEFIRMTFMNAASQPESGTSGRPPGTQPDDPLMAGLGRKRLRSVVAERGVIVKTLDLDKVSRRLLTRAEIRCEQLNYDNVSGQAAANGSGALLLEDYRPASKPAAGGEPAGAPGIPLGGMRPSQTQVCWEKQMRMDRDRLEVVFDGVVRMGHRGANGLLIAPDGTVAIRPNEPITVLNCAKLTLKLVGQAAEPKADAADGGIAAMADTIRDLDYFRADENVVLRSGDSRSSRTLLADFLEYRKNSNFLQFGCLAQRKAEIFDIAADGSRFNHFTAPSIEWDMNTGRVKPFEGRFIVTGGGN